MKKLLVVLLVLGLATPAMAASQWYWYGTSRMFLGYVDNSKEFNNPSASSFPYGGGDPSLDTSIRASGSVNGVSDSGLILNLADTTKIGAKVVASDTISAGAEISIYQVPADITFNAPGSGAVEKLSIDSVIVRVLYAQWKFGAGSLRVGQDYTPATFLLYSNEIGDMGWGSDEIMTVHSIPYISRRPQLKLTFGGFQVALIEHNTTVSYQTIRELTTYNAAAPASTDAIDDEDFTLPRIELAYQWNISPMISLRPIAGYQTYDAVQRSGSTEVSKTITSYHFGLGANLRFGAAYVNLAAASGQNPGNYGLFQPNASTTRFASINLTTGDVQDATFMSGMAVVGFTVNPTLKLEAGFGYLKTENKIAYGGLKLEQASMNYYVQAPITLAPGVMLTPEIGFLDMGDLENKTLNSKTKAGSAMWVAAQFRIDF